MLNTSGSCIELFLIKADWVGSSSLFRIASGQRQEGRGGHIADYARRVKGNRGCRAGRRGLGLHKWLGLVPSPLNHISWRRNSSEVRKCRGTMRVRSVAEVELWNTDCCY